MELISKEEVLKIVSKWLTGEFSAPIYADIKEELNALPSVKPEEIKANVKRLYRYEKAAAKKRDGKG